MLYFESFGSTPPKTPPATKANIGNMNALPKDPTSKSKACRLKISQARSPKGRAASTQKGMIQPFRCHSVQHWARNAESNFGSDAGSSDSKVRLSQSAMPSEIGGSPRRFRETAKTATQYAAVAIVSIVSASATVTLLQ